MTVWIYFLVGVLVGWITKVPFLIKWYRELREDKIDRQRMYDRIVAMDKKEKK